MQLPLLFSFRQVVVGDGFLAGVRMNGRAILDHPEAPGEEIGISGVAPVGISGGGADRGLAFAEFRNAWVSVLFDIASEASSFEQFQTDCTAFLESRVPHLSAEWDAALEVVRQKHYVDATLKSEVVNGDQLAFEVVDLSHLQAEANQIEAGVKQAA